MNRIGILGGTFDPFHYGHLSIAKAAAEEFNLEKIILLPTKVQPFKIGREITDKEHRLNMAKIIAATNKNFIISAFEINNDEVSYTYNTLIGLRKEFPTGKLYFIMGADSFLSLETWYKGVDLLKEFSFIIAFRPGYDTGKILEKIKEMELKYGADISLLHNQVLDISSTEIKSRVRKSESIEDFVPFEIAEYINEHKLYK